jgi:hypothetical protein
MFGVEGRYTDEGVKTFAKDELLELFSQAGFLSCHTHAPLPDYKIVRGIITSEGLGDEQFNSGELASQLSNSDPQMPRNPNFNIRSAWLGVGKAGLDADLANSFLIEAKLGPASSSILADNLAFWYGGNRAPNFLKEKAFFRTSNSGEVNVSETPMQLESNPTNNIEIFSQTITESSIYYQGPLYADEIFRYLAQVDWSIEGLSNRIRIFLDHCGDWARVNNLDWPPAGSISGKVDGRLVDLSPRNVKIDHNSNFHPFDLEWKYQESIDLCYLSFRVLNDLLSSALITNHWNGSHHKVSLLETIEACLVWLGFDEKEIEKAVSLEAQLQSFVSDSGVTQDLFLQSLRRPLFLQSVNQELQSVNQELQSVNQELQSVNQELQSVNQELLLSTSWRVTRPLREISRCLRKLKIRFPRIVKR